jgi:hypothetical protein
VKLGAISYDNSREDTSTLPDFEVIDQSADTAPINETDQIAAETVDNPPRYDPIAAAAKIEAMRAMQQRFGKR